jgi:hypothetical protein
MFLKSSLELLSQKISNLKVSQNHGLRGLGGVMIGITVFTRVCIREISSLESVSDIFFGVVVVIFSHTQQFLGWVVS